MMLQLFQLFIPLVGRYVSYASALLFPCLGLGVLCACPYIARRIIDNV